MLVSFLTVPATIVLPGVGANSVGDPVDDWDNPVSESEAGCWVEPITSEEDSDLRQSDVRLYRLFFDTTVDVPASARVLVDGLVLEVSGPALLRRTVRGPHHQEVRCKSVVG